MPRVYARGYKRPFATRVRLLTDDAVRAIRADERGDMLVALAWGVDVTTVAAVRSGRRKAGVSAAPPVALLTRPPPRI